MLEKNIYNWKYRFYSEGRFEIVPNEEYDKPTVLWKLYALNKNSVDAVVSQYVYATHPWQVNDLFDCNEDLLDFDDEEMIHHFLKDVIPEEELNKKKKDNPNGLKILVQRNFREILYKKWGIFSMTDNPNNVLLWSYYGNHKGFCIEFDLTQFPFEYYGPFPINYQSELNALSIKDIGIHLGVLAQCNLKDKIWEHENEWRLMIPKPKGEDMRSPAFKFLKDMGGHDRKFNYPLSAIRSITLANRFFEPDEIKEISNSELEINLTEDIELKASLLDFIAANKIPSFLGLKTGFTTLGFKKISINKIKGKDIYNINAC
ncbi:MAG: DUF2971 domain-containing protein [Bacteroidales bacterium]|nr:DUF2971 domain-containing protein [Bacteroidales bacterium]